MDRTAKKQWAFVACLSETGNVSRACQYAKIPRRTTYDGRAKDPAVAASWDEALDVGVSALEGVDKPVFYRGEECGAIREYSDTLAIFLLKAHRPDKYKERSAVEHSVDLSLAARLDAARQRVRPEPGEALATLSGLDGTFHDLKLPPDDGG